MLRMDVNFRTRSYDRGQAQNVLAGIARSLQEDVAVTTGSIPIIDVGPIAGQAIDSNYSGTILAEAAADDTKDIVGIIKNYFRYQDMEIQASNIADDLTLPRVA